MKISKIEFENFRNFKEKGQIICDTSGKTTIIYGKNGDGKTTLHQLFQWIFYNKVSFNKTASDKMYNLEFEKEQEYHAVFSVLGSIDFEHNGEFYSLRREWKYQKELESSKKIQEDVSLNKKDGDNNWNRLNNPPVVIEELLPSGLTEYFFFDGESMIADLRVKGKDSADKLKKALFSIFDLNLLEQANKDIGRTDLKTTALGQLYLGKSNINSGSNITAVKTTIENAQSKIALIEDDITKLNIELSAKKKFINDVSEEIGTTKSKSEYETKRKALKSQRDNLLANESSFLSDFGDEVISSFPKMLLSKTVENAKKIIKLKIDESKLIEGLDKRLIQALKKEQYCICGNKLTEKEYRYLEEQLQLFPPFSYKTSYDTFNRESQRSGKQYDREKIERYIKQVLNNRQQAAKCDSDIQKLDEEEKKSKDIENLIVDRKKAEDRISELTTQIIEQEKMLDKYNILLRREMKSYDELTSQSDLHKKITDKIEIMNLVKQYFERKLEESANTYSQKLKDGIEMLLSKMLTSKRSVTVNSDFYVRVFDSYDDESKSEGQFAIVSFAYIGGILNLLKKESELSAKEYPLVLDGPFSKLDADQRQNVINTIPEYAPQVILFSKDDLQEYFTKDSIGRVWTIKSNDEKNVATVEEGYLWQ